MRNLRQQVDQIDLSILQLLQKRTKLALRIGEAKRRHQAPVYVPEREHELFARVDRLSRGKLPAGAAVAIYREILSGSRATQGQGAVGLLEADADLLTGPARWCFGACDSFALHKNWAALARGLAAGQLAVVVLSGLDLVKILGKPAARREFLSRFRVAGDFSSLIGWRVPPDQRIFIVLPRETPTPLQADRLLVLIKCKFTEKAVKTWFRSMARDPLYADLRATPLASMRRSRESLFFLTLPKAVDAGQIIDRLQGEGSGNVLISILGAYLSSEGYGG